jgi:hypothetical protein
VFEKQKAPRLRGRCEERRLGRINSPWQNTYSNFKTRIKPLAPAARKLQDVLNQGRKASPRYNAIWLRSPIACAEISAPGALAWLTWMLL